MSGGEEENSGKCGFLAGGREEERGECGFLGGGREERIVVNVVF
jgi:hypothetical protein